MFFTPLFLSNLTTKKIARNIEYFRTLDSTNTEIFDMLKQNQAKSGDAIIADQQTAGRGRRGNNWISNPGESITCSIIIKDEDDSLVKKLPLISGIAIIKGIKQLTKLNCNLKWPNDILLDSKKIGGILIEKKDGYFIIGIGLNVNESELDKSIENSTSIRLELGRTVQREPLLAFIFNHFETLLGNNLSSIINEWESLCLHMDRMVKFHQSNQLMSVTFLGLNENGEANIQTDDGKKIINSGIIEL